MGNPAKSKKASTKKLESVKEPQSMKKTSQSSKAKTPQKVTNSKTKKEKKTKASKIVKSKKSKKEVDPNKPKKPQVGFFLWMNEKGRESIKKNNSNMTHKEVISECGNKWRGFTNSQKKP